MPSTTVAHTGTSALAHFLASTGPEQFQKASMKQQQTTPFRFLGRLRRPPPPQPHTEEIRPRPKKVPRESVIHASKATLQLRSVSVQTSAPTCRQCRQQSARRLSSPASLPTGKLLGTPQDLWAMIEALKSQLAHEQASRLQLEQALALVHP
jgi:hypothetical protein